VYWHTSAEFIWCNFFLNRASGIDAKDYYQYEKKEEKSQLHGTCQKTASSCFFARTFTLSLSLSNKDTYTHTRTNSLSSIHTQPHTLSFKHTHTHIHTHTHTHKHTHTHNFLGHHFSDFRFHRVLKCFLWLLTNLNL